MSFYPNNNFLFFLNIHIKTLNLTESKKEMFIKYINTFSP